MNKELRFECGNCKTQWKSSDAASVEVGARAKLKGLTTSDFTDGYNCPTCGSTDISGEDV